MAKAKTGPCEPYSDADLMDLGYHVVQVVDDTGDAPTSIRAQVEFHGTVARTGNGVRTFTLDQLTQAQRDRIVVAAHEAMRLQSKADQAKPKSTYDRKGWLAQFRQLGGTIKGRTAMERAGVTASRETQLRWLSEKQSAGTNNQSAIHRAYEAIRMENVHTAQDQAEEGIREVAEIFDEIMSEAYGSNGVRFRDIQP